MCVYAYVYTPVRAYKINTKNISMNSVHMYICICMYVSMYVMYVCVYYIYMCVYVLTHTCIQTERQRESHLQMLQTCQMFHTFAYCISYT